MLNADQAKTRSRGKRGIYFLIALGAEGIPNKEAVARCVLWGEVGGGVKRQVGCGVANTQIVPRAKPCRFLS